jgi:hypothetical protein
LKPKWDEPLSNFAFNFNLRRYIKGVPREVARQLPIILVVDEQEDLIMLILQYLDRRGLLGVFGDLDGDDDGANILGNIIVKRPAAFHVIKNGGEIQVSLHWNEFYRYVFALHGVKRLTYTDAELADADVNNRCDGKNPLKGSSKAKTADQAWGEQGSDSDSEDDDPADDLPHLESLRTSWRHNLSAITQAQGKLRAIDSGVAQARVGAGWITTARHVTLRVSPQGAPSFSSSVTQLTWRLLSCYLPTWRPPPPPPPPPRWVSPGRRGRQ